MKTTSFNKKILFLLGMVILAFLVYTGTMFYRNQVIDSGNILKKSDMKEVISNKFGFSLSYPYYYNYNQDAIPSAEDTKDIKNIVMVLRASNSSYRDEISILYFPLKKPTDFVEEILKFQNMNETTKTTLNDLQKVTIKDNNFYKVKYSNQEEGGKNDYSRYFIMNRDGTMMFMFASETGKNIQPILETLKFTN